jgi:APA family basic amino acid/polyamine antiporter
MAVENSSEGIWGFFRLIGLGVGAVLFTYDGWVDIMHAAGEVEDPKKNLPLGLTLGVVLITTVYLLTNYAYLRVVPLHEMAGSESLAAVVVAEKTFGSAGGKFISLLMMISILGALGGLIMTFPRLLFAAGVQYSEEAKRGGTVGRLFQLLATVSSGSKAPSGAILMSCVTAILALVFFQSFSSIVNFFVVPNHLFNILLVAAVFKFAQGNDGEKFKPFGFPVIPIIYIVTIAGFLISALVYRPGDTLMGVGLSVTGVPVYYWLERRKK